MRRIMYSVLFTLLCLSAIVLSPPALAAPREMNELSTYTANNSLQGGGAYMSSRYNIAGVELYSYPAWRIRQAPPSQTTTRTRTKTAGADTFFYDDNGETGAE